MRTWLLPILLAAPAAAAPLKQPGKLALDVRSSAFGPSEAIPSEFTCDGAGIVPPLRWSKPPRDTKSIAVLVEDRDAASGTFAHWIVTELSPVTTNLRGDAAIPHAAIAGKNDAGQAGWTPPCPPSGVHHYVFHVYALDKHLGSAPLGRADL